jgi:succinoglycan biosynthesis protein ExoA
MRTLSVIVPCRNEAEHIDAFLESMFAQRLDAHDQLEVIVADGMSTDGTRERLAEWQRRKLELVVIDNPPGITSSALNRAVERARGEIIVRMDVHTTYSPDYVVECANTLERTGATCVGGAWRPRATQGLQRAIARAFESGFGSGGAQSRRGDYSGPVDTVYLGAWRRADLVRLGGFDEKLVRNQDDELNLRILRSGGQVWQSATIRSSYTPRGSLPALFRQFYQYGYWKVAVIRKHRLPASPRHLVPFAFLVVLCSLLLVAPFVPLAGVIAAVLLSVYAAVALASAMAMRESRAMSIAVAFACMHFGYGLGFVHGLFDFILRRRAPRNAATRLTR